MFVQKTEHTLYLTTSLGLVEKCLAIFAYSELEQLHPVAQCLSRCIYETTILPYTSMIINLPVNLEYSLYPNHLLTPTNLDTKLWNQPFFSNFSPGRRRSFVDERAPCLIDRVQSQIKWWTTVKSNDSSNLDANITIEDVKSLQIVVVNGIHADCAIIWKKIMRLIVSKSVRWNVLHVQLNNRSVVCLWLL